MINEKMIQEARGHANNVKTIFENKDLFKYLQLPEIERIKDNAQYNIIYYANFENYVDMYMDSYMSELGWYIQDFINNVEHSNQDLEEIIINKIDSFPLTYASNMIGTYCGGFLYFDTENNKIPYELFREILNEFIEILELQDNKPEINISNLVYEYSNPNTEDTIKEYKKASDAEIIQIFQFLNKDNYYSREYDQVKNNSSHLKNLFKLINYILTQIESYIEDLDIFLKQMIESDLDNLYYCFDSEEAPYINDYYLLDASGEIIKEYDYSKNKFQDYKYS